MDYDKDKVDDMVLALLWLTTFGENSLARLSYGPGKVTIGTS
jgi:hypothetical protein